MLVYVSHPNTGEEDKKIVEDFIKENLKKYKDITFIGNMMKILNLQKK